MARNTRSLVALFSLVVLSGCGPGLLDDPTALDGSSGAGVATDDDGSSGAGDTDGQTSGSPPPASSGGVDESGDPEPDPCEAFEEGKIDREQTCGLVSVGFEWGDSELDAAAQCQLMAAAPCIAAQLVSGVLYLESHASSDEAVSERAAIILTTSAAPLSTNSSARAA
ncbi:MAG: hypothetical protein K0V04_15125 [Deltaproteobacteria bacterium]|nr:hypothetical protein [Deltaproteobacteria bacterium]